MPRLEYSKDLADELVNNSVALQKASLELIESTNKMVGRMDRILSLFEEAVKNIELAEPKEPLAKQLESLLEQNRVIARGLVLIEKYIRDKTSVGFNPEVTKKLPRI